MSALNPGQQQIANLIYHEGVQAGLSPHRALELVAAAYMESGLHSEAVNQRSGATGLFQLLSSGYVNAANQMGGAKDPVANIHAILPSYLNYWHTHPNAMPGEAAAMVERSGKGPSWYAQPLHELSKLTGSSTDTPLPLQGANLGVSPDSMAGQLAAGLIKSNNEAAQGKSSMESVIPLLALGRSQAQSSTGGGASSTSSQASGASLPGAPTKLDSRLVAVAHSWGLKINSGLRSPEQNSEVGGAPNSYHLHGEAIDVQPSQNAMLLAAEAYKKPQAFTEFFGPFPWRIKNGHLFPGAQPGHTDHVHIVLAGA